MALVSRRSTLNPNAPLFIPAAVRQVEDFSPEWWDLVTTSAWFREYWLSEHDAADTFGDDDDDFPRSEAVELLPDTLDLSCDDGFSYQEELHVVPDSAEFDEDGSSPFLAAKSFPAKGLEGGGGAMARSLNLHRSSRESCNKAAIEGDRCWEKPARLVNPRCSPRRIQQPR